MERAWAEKSSLGWQGKHSLLIQKNKGFFSFLAELILDIYQDVRLWNRFSKPHSEDKLKPHPDLLAMTKNDWQGITSAAFRKIFKKSAVKRTKFSGLRRNISFF